MYNLYNFFRYYLYRKITCTQTADDKKEAIVKY